VGQGALAIEGRADDDATAALLAPLHDAGTFAATTAERGMLNALGAGCAAPVGALALVPQGSSVYLHGFVLSHDGRTIVEGKETGAISDAAECGRTLAGRLIREGADKLL
jgi:hydroxymethylbilane synthase